MKVQCSLCQYEDNGYCSKKKRSSKPLKIKVNKRRSCGLYEEDAFRVLQMYRKKEAHRAKLINMERRRVYLSEAIEKLKLEGARHLITPKRKGSDDKAK